MIWSALEQAVETSPEVIETGYQLQQSDVDGLFTAIAGLTSLSWFSLLSQLITVGVLLVVILVIAMRRV